MTDSLLSRLQILTEPSREIDEEIALMLVPRAQHEALMAALQFVHDIAAEELPHVRVGTGAEVALRHIKRRTGEALRAAGIQIEG